MHLCRITLVTSCLFFALSSFSQLNLKPSIGLTALPADTASICAIAWCNDNTQYEATGLQNGDTIHHFQLYDINGNPTDIEQKLLTGKPVLLVAGSYTCPVYRGKVPDINNIAAQYAGQLSVYIIYVVEPHPDSPDLSPYSQTIWTTNQNINEGILYPQPTTYGERKAIVQDMLANMTINVPVLIDGPCNAWWNTFGCAPNNAYLIDTDGTVFVKHGWFHRPPYDMYADIDSLLGITGINNAAATATARVYPNPSAGGVTFELPSGGIYQVEIINALGQAVARTEYITVPEYTFYDSNILPGMYFYKVTRPGDNFVSSGKLVIK